MGQAFAEQPPERKGRGRPTREDQELPTKDPASTGFKSCWSVMD